jgi:two-component system sensor histidine kinase QseC
VRRRWSLQRRVIVSAVVIFIAASCASGYLSYSLVRRNMLKSFDFALEARARALAALVHCDAHGRCEMEPGVAKTGGRHEARATEFFEIRDAQGRVVAQSQPDALRQFPLKWHHRTTEGGRFNLRLPDGRRARAVCLGAEAALDDDEDVTPKAAARSVPTPISVVVVRERESLDGALTAVEASLFLAGLLVTVGGAGALGITLRRGLRPVQTLAARVGALEPASLATRVCTPDLPYELATVAEKIDQFLERLEESLERERRYSSDVAHELRTPLAEIHTALEVALRWPGDHTLLLQASRQALESSQEAEALINALLELARHGQDAAAPLLEVVDAGRIVAEEAAQLDAAIREKKLCLTVSPDLPRLLANAHLLRAVVRNLLANAVEYSVSRSRIDIAGKWDGDRASVEIRNPAPELTADDLLHITEPFWRKDAARSDRRHAGLGLTITQSLCKMMGLTLTLRMEPDAVLVAEVSGPAGSAPPPGEKNASGAADGGSTQSTDASGQARADAE